VKRTRRRLGRRGGFSRNKLTRRLLHLYRSFVLHLLKQLHGLGVSTVYLSYPFNVAQDKGNEFTVNMWSYRKLMSLIESKAQEYGMKAFEVVEYNTSKYCAYHEVEVARNPRGVISCPKGHKLHSDLNGALNILKKAAGMVISTIEKPLSFMVDHNGVAPVMWRNPRDLGNPRPSVLRRGQLSCCERLKTGRRTTFVEGLLLIGGLLFIAVGVMFLLLSSAREELTEGGEEGKGRGQKSDGEEKGGHESGKTEGGVVILIGPLPIVIGSNPKVVKELVVIAVLLFLFALFIYFLLR